MLIREELEDLRNSKNDFSESLHLPCVYMSPMTTDALNETTTFDLKLLIKRAVS